MRISSGDLNNVVSISILENMLCEIWRTCSSHSRRLWALSCWTAISRNGGTFILNWTWSFIFIVFFINFGSTYAPRISPNLHTRNKVYHDFFLSSNIVTQNSPSRWISEESGAQTKFIMIISQFSWILMVRNLEFFSNINIL